MSKEDTISFGDVTGKSSPYPDGLVDQIMIPSPSGEIAIKHPLHMSLFIYYALDKGLPITFVREFCFYAVNLLKVQQAIVVPAVSSCTFMEISNRDSHGWRTACVVAHMTNIQPRTPECLQASIKLLIKSLHEQGGDIETAKIQLFGGISELDSNQKVHYKVERANIIKEIGLYCKANNLNIPNIAQPKNHWIKKLPEGQSWEEAHTACKVDTLDYILTRFGLWFRRANVSRDAAYDLISCDVPKGTSPGRRELFCQIMDNPENNLATAKTVSQTANLIKSWKQFGILSIPHVLPVNQSGLFRSSEDKEKTAKNDVALVTP